jgi:hypothetical protein
MWMGIGGAIFTGLGTTLSALTENFGLIGIGPAIGIAFGLSIGQSIENKYNKEGRIRPLTEAEKRKRKNVILLGVALLSLGVIVFSILYLRK